ncbi:MAG: cobalt-factor II C(20)-methyltransferase [Euryarchaeota archaeon]|nr:cobalt-factor II C(20)-methyltransferase [Euryarchaeota archaeon]
MLIGVGLGPGDPSLLTLLAVDVLKSAIKVFVPGRLAFDLVKPYADPEILTFPMTHDVERLQKAWRQHVEEIARYAVDGPTAFGVIGDPNIFSTFSHLAKMMRIAKPHVQITTVPGVSAVTACFSRLNEQVGASFVISDGSAVESKLALKATKPRDMANTFREEGFTDLVLLERGFTKKEKVYTKNFPLKGEYFSILYGKRT